MLLSDIASGHQDLATHIVGSRYRWLDLDLNLVLNRPLIKLWAAKLHIFVFLVMRTIAEFKKIHAAARGRPREHVFMPQYCRIYSGGARRPWHAGAHLALAPGWPEMVG